MTTTTTFTYARPSDLRDCYTLDLHCYERAWSESTWRRCLADRGAVTFVLRAEGKVVGWVTGTRNRGYVDVQKIGVLPHERGKGYCRRLVEGLGLGELRVVLREGNRVGLEVGKALGFRPVKVLRNRFDNEDGILMVRATVCE
jgi:GNAT superfamily N-acetyltransferase